MPSPDNYLLSKPKSTKNKLTTMLYGPLNKKNVLLNLLSENKKLKLLMPLSKKPLKP